MCDAVEITLRFFTSLLFSEILHDGEFSPGIRNLLVDSIEHPTMGSWLSLMREACGALKAESELQMPAVAEFCRTTLLAQVQGSPAKSESDDDPAMEDVEKYYLPLRNFMAHSGRMSSETAARLHAVHRPRFIAFCQSLAFLNDSRLLAVSSGEVYNLTGPGPIFPRLAEYPAELAAQEDRLIFCVCGNDLDQYPARCLDVFPLVYYSEVFMLRPGESEKKRAQSFQIYTRANKDSLEYTILCAPEHISFVHKSAQNPFNRFREIFRLEEWKQQRRDQQSLDRLSREFGFSDLIQLLTDLFVGRQQQLKELKHWYQNNDSGVCWVEGFPGTGKSALMAKLISNLKGSSWGLFSGKDSDPARARYILIPYFFRDNDDPMCNENKFLEAVTVTVQSWLKKSGCEGFALTPKKQLVDLKEARENFKNALNAFSRAMQTLPPDQRKRLIIVMDGMDVIERKAREVMSHPFDNVLPSVLWICSGTPGLVTGAEPHCDRIFGNNGLPFLSADEVKTWLTNATDRAKYDLFERDQPDGTNPFIETLIQRSQGLAIYLSYVVDDIRNGNLSFYGENALPESLEAYYDGILAGTDDVAAVSKSVLMLLALAREPLCMDTIIYALSIDRHVDRNPGLVHSAVSRYGRTIADAPIPQTIDKYGKTIYHQTFRDHLLSSKAVETEHISILCDVLPGLLRYLDEFAPVSDDPTYNYVLRHLPSHMLDAAQRDTKEGKAFQHRLALFKLITGEDFVQGKVEHAGLLFELIEDYRRALALILGAPAEPGRKDVRIPQITRLLLFDFSCLDQDDQQELLREFWFEQAAETIALYCRKSEAQGHELLKTLLQEKDRTRGLTRVALRAAELNGDYLFLLNALEAESHRDTGDGDDDDFASLNTDDPASMNRLIVNALFLTARRQIEAQDWSGFSGLVQELSNGLTNALPKKGQSLITRAAKTYQLTVQRKSVMIHVKSLAEVIYKILINYPQHPAVLAHLSRIGADLGDLLYESPANLLVKFPPLLPAIYSIVTYIWDRVAENSRNRTSIENLFTVSSKKQQKIITDFTRLILTADYEDRRAADTFPALAELAFDTGLMASSDEMFQVNRAFHGHLLYHMQKYFPAEFENLYVRKYYLPTADSGVTRIHDLFAEPLAKRFPDGLLDANLERIRGMYEMLARFLTYEAVNTDDPASLLLLNEELVRFIISRDPDLFCQDYNITGRPLHILTAMVLAEARVAPWGMSRTIGVIEEIRDGALMPLAIEAVRWEAISKCFFDLFYAGIFQVEPVLLTLSRIVDMKSLASVPHTGDASFAPETGELMELFMITESTSPDRATLQAMRKAAGRFALAMLSLRSVNREKVLDYCGQNGISEAVWQKSREWSLYMEKQYPSPKKKNSTVDQMVEKYYEQLAIGLFTNIIMVQSEEIRGLMARLLHNLLQANEKQKAKGGLKKDDLMGLLRGIVEDAFDLLKKNSHRKR